MSHDDLARKNKHPKVGFQKYLHTFNEPKDNFRDVSSVEDNDFIGDTHYMRRRFRTIAKNLRDEV